MQSPIQVKDLTFSVVQTPGQPLPYKAVAARKGVVVRERPVQTEEEGLALVRRWAQFAP